MATAPLWIINPSWVWLGTHLPFAWGEPQSLTRELNARFWDAWIFLYGPNPLSGVKVGVLRTDLPEGNSRVPCTYSHFTSILWKKWVQAQWMTRWLLYLGDPPRALNNFHQRAVYQFPAVVKRRTEDNDGLTDFKLDRDQLRHEELHVLVRLLEIIPTLQKT